MPCPRGSRTTAPGAPARRRSRGSSGPDLRRKPRPPRRDTACRSRRRGNSRRRARSAGNRARASCRRRGYRDTCRPSPALPVLAPRKATARASSGVGAQHCCAPHATPRRSLIGSRGRNLAAPGPTPVTRIQSLLSAAVLLRLTPALAQTGVIAPNENLVTDGLPPIPVAIAEAARRYSDFHSAAFWDWHPTRREAIIGTRLGDVQQVYRLRSPGGERTQLTFFPDPVSGASYQPTDGRYIVITKDSGGAEFFQKYRYDVTTGEITLLTDGKSRNVGGAWSHQGDRYAYMSTRRTGRDLDLWVVDPSNPTTDHMALELQGGGYGPLDWSPDDRTILLGQGVSVNESYLWLVDLARGEKTLLAPQPGSEPVAYRDAKFSRDGKGIYLSTDQGSEFQRLAYLDLATKRYRFLTTAIPWDVDEFDLSPDDRWIACVTNEDGVGTLHVLNAATGTERRIPRLPAGLISDVRWRKRGAELGFTRTSARAPADAYSLELTSGTVTRWTESETAGLNTHDFAEAELVHWPSFDGRAISGFLYKPPARLAGRRPVIINIHGGPEGQSRPGFLGRNNLYVNELGIAIIFPNIRGSTGYGQTFTKLDKGV